MIQKSFRLLISIYRYDPVFQLNVFVEQIPRVIRQIRKKLDNNRFFNAGISLSVAFLIADRLSVTFGAI